MVQPPFKNRNYLKKAARKRTLKQIVTTITNQARKGPASAGTFVSVKAGESVKFKFKYSDISGLKAKYRDPKTGLRFASTEEFKRISKLTPVEVRDFLAFRGGVETRAF